MQGSGLFEGTWPGEQLLNLTSKDFDREGEVSESDINRQALPRRCGHPRTPPRSHGARCVSPLASEAGTAIRLPDLASGRGGLLNRSDFLTKTSLSLSEGLGIQSHVGWPE